MAIGWLDDDIWFPDPRNGEPDGLFAAGGDLKTERLLLAYQNGIFPWFGFKERSSPLWYCPMDRFVIFPSEVHVSRSMRKLIKSGRYEVTFNKDFRGVIESCSKAQGRDKLRGAWLGKDMIDAYTILHDMGYAHSVEVWENEYDEKKLVGGIYGVAMGKGFFGESMFSLVPSGSKLALIYLCNLLEKNNFALLDCQFETPHLLSMGGRHIPYDKYMELISV